MRVVLFCFGVNKCKEKTARFGDSHGSVASFGFNKLQIYYEALDCTITTDTTAYFKLVSVVKSVVSNSNCVTPEELITWYDKDIN